MSIAIAGKASISLTKPSTGQINQALSLDDFFKKSCEGYALIENGNGLLCTTSSVPDNRFPRWSPIRFSNDRDRLESLSDELTLKNISPNEPNKPNEIALLLEEIARPPRTTVRKDNSENGLDILSKRFGIFHIDIKTPETGSSKYEYFFLNVPLSNTNKVNGKPAQGVLFPIARTMSFGKADWDLAPHLKFAEGGMRSYILIGFKKQFIAIDHHGNAYLASNVRC